MLNSRYFLRLLLTGAYALIAFAYLRLLYTEDTFCDRSGGVSLTVLRLTVSILILDRLASLLGMVLSRVGKASRHSIWLRAASAALIVGGILFFTPDWLYESHLVDSLDRTSFDISCLVEEGYGMFFFAVVALPFALLTFSSELLLDRLSRRAMKR